MVTRHVQQDSYSPPKNVCNRQRQFPVSRGKEEENSERKEKKTATYPPARYNYYELLLHTTRARAYSITYPLFDNTMKEAEDLVTWMSIYLFMVIPACSLSYHYIFHNLL